MVFAGRSWRGFIRPDEDDYFVLKPKHSAFYETTLDLLPSLVADGSLTEAARAAQK